MGKGHDPREVELVRQVASRAVRRLNVLEFMLLFLAAALALAAGALAAWLLSSTFGFSFRWGWAGASLLLFVVPAGVAYLREIRQSAGKGGAPTGPQAASGRKPNSKPGDLHG